MASIKQQPVYELLGAPLLLFRNESCYSPWHDEPVNMDYSSFLEHQRRIKRCQARWYYPMDYANIRPVLHRLPDGFLGPGFDDTYDPPSSDFMSDFYCLSIKEPFIFEKDQGDDSDNIDWMFVKDQTHPYQQEARAHMLLADEESRTDPDKLLEKLRILRRHQQYDVNALPRTPPRKKAVSKPRRYNNTALKLFRLSTRAAKLTHRLTHERLNRSDPSYLAPFDSNLVEELAREDFRMRFPATNAGGKEARYLRQNVYYGDMDDVNAPVHYGNCLLAVTCPCSFCRITSSDPSWCLLHATGPLLEKLCCSFLRFPEDELSEQNMSNAQPAELDLGDGLRQLEECGTNMYVARTMIHCTVFEIVPDAPVESSCQQRVRFRVLHRIDGRRRNMFLPSFLPIDLACHPKYGREWTDANMVVLFKDTKRNEQKALWHYQMGDTLRATKHIINNLQSISTIEFSSHHPMVLWSIARSHVCPALAESQTSTRHPRSGRGHSLYSIDLRSDQGTFQWSPSAEDYRVEGTHSLSGITTDWVNAHTIWASSVSAGRTWEIDTRMPCRSVCSWSLPSTCDDTETVLPPMGLHGAGCLFACPKGSKQQQLPAHPSAMFSVGLTPLTYGIHVYQQPAMDSRYQTKNLESPSGPALAFLGDANIATSASFPLPDVSDKVFTCGLAVIELPTSRVLAANKLAQLGYGNGDVDGALCVATVTNKGDIYSHIMLASTSTRGQRVAYNDLPLGSSSVPLPDSSSEFLSSLSSDVFSGPGRICVSLKSQYPCPSASIIASRTKGTSRPVELDLPTTGRPTESPASNGVHVRPSVTHEAMIAGTEPSDSGITLPEALAEGAWNELEDAFDSFDHVSLRHKPMSSADSRSDVTSQVLSKAATAWPELDDDSSET